MFGVTSMTYCAILGRFTTVVSHQNRSTFPAGDVSTMGCKIFTEEPPNVNTTKYIHLGTYPLNHIKSDGTGKLTKLRAVQINKHEFIVADQDHRNKYPLIYKYNIITRKWKILLHQHHYQLNFPDSFRFEYNINTSMAYFIGVDKLIKINLNRNTHSVDDIFKNNALNKPTELPSTFLVKDKLHIFGTSLSSYFCILIQTNLFSDRPMFAPNHNDSQKPYYSKTEVIGI